MTDALQGDLVEIKVPTIGYRAGRMVPGYVRLSIAKRDADEQEFVGGVSMVSFVESKCYEPVRARYGEPPIIGLARLLNAGKHASLSKKESDLLDSQIARGVDGAGLGVDLTGHPVAAAMQAEAVSILLVDGVFHARTRGPAHHLSWRHVGNGVVDGFHPLLVDGFTAMYERCDDLVASSGKHGILNAWHSSESQDFLLWSLSHKVLGLTRGASIGSLDMQTLAAVHALRRTLFEVLGSDPYSLRNPFSMTHAWGPPKHPDLAANCARAIEAMLDDEACSSQWGIIGMKMEGVEAIREHMGVFDLEGAFLS